MNINEYIQINTKYISRNKIEKKFNQIISNLTNFHFKNCLEYRKILKTKKYDLKNNNLEKQPYLPATLFKEIILKSVSNKKIVKTLHSSGTSGANTAKIFLDESNAKNQKVVLSKILKKYIGFERLPMLIVAQNPISKVDKNLFSAKYAAILGFSIFGKNHTYLINKDGKIDYPILNNFLNKYSKKKFLVFGFTSNIYEYLLTKLSTNKIKKDFKKAILIHGGGWKKMLDKKISNIEFRNKSLIKLKISTIYNYYGLVEQTGSIFLECPKCHCFVTTPYSNIIIRDKLLHSINYGRGIIQLISVLPTSYPGHSILTQDEGEIINNHCDCKRFGKRFIVHGRVHQSEIRGCSDI